MALIARMVLALLSEEQKQHLDRGGAVEWLTPGVSEKLRLPFGDKGGALEFAMPCAQCNLIAKCHALACLLALVHRDVR